MNRFIGARDCIRDQRGITGLETAIVLIAFVVVASVFAFTVLNTGLLSAEKSKETALAGLAETSATVSIRGSVIALKNTGTTTPNQIDNVKFQLTSSSQASTAVDISADGVVVSYQDNNQAVNIATSQYTLTWLIGSGPLLGPNEAVEMNVDISALTTPLATSTEFTIQVRPNVGAVVILNRTTPPELKNAMDLN